MLKRNRIRTIVMRCIRQELQPFKLASNGREAFDISKFSLISCDFQVQQLLIDALDYHGSYMTFDQHTMEFQSTGLDF